MTSLNIASMFMSANGLRKGRHITTAYVRQAITGERQKASTAHSSISTTLMD
jgi:hypothetical protein